MESFNEYVLHVLRNTAYADWHATTRIFSTYTAAAGSSKTSKYCSIRIRLAFLAALFGSEAGTHGGDAGEFFIIGLFLIFVAAPIKLVLIRPENTEDRLIPNLPDKWLSKQNPPKAIDC